MSSRLIAVILSLVALNGWCESVPQTGAFIFIEIKPPSTSQDSTVKSTTVYLNEKGLVQRYACEDNNIKELQEGSLPVAGENIFKTLSAISSTAPPDKKEANRNMPQPSQAIPGNTRIVVRQSSGVDYKWAGVNDAVPSQLQKLVQESSELAGTLKAQKPAAGAFVRATILSANRLDEYRAFKLLKTVQNLNDLDPILQDALVNPFRLIPVPGGEKGKNPFSAFAIKGESSPLLLLFNGTGYEIRRYSVAPASPSSP